ncbi:MAG: Fur family transcriptional regulator [Acidimicrobiales bacterium]
MSHSDQPAENLDVLHDRVASQLSSVDQRYTHGRRNLVGLLAQAGRPVTLPELLLMDTEMPQSSVYRNLDVLERTGLVQRITTGSEHARFELSEPLLGHHHHLICMSCGMVEDVRFDTDFEQLIDDRLATVADGSGFDVMHHSLDLHGHCGTCRTA